MPTASHQAFTDYSTASQYIEDQEFPLFVKASGLARGQGAIQCDNHQEAETALKDLMIRRRFGEAGKTTIVEEYLDGPEISLHALCSNTDYLLFQSAQDYKPRFEGDTGPNTGSMGTVANPPWLSDDLLESLGQQFVAPILDKLAEQDRPYRGLLYPSIKLTSNGPKLVEYNCRFGDSEAQAYMPPLNSDILTLLTACGQQDLSNQEISWNNKSSVCVNLVSEFYPEESPMNRTIEGIEDASKVDGVVIFHTGTKKIGNRTVTNGGRVLNVVGVGDTVREAQQQAYKATSKIGFQGKKMRIDIGDKTIRQQSIE